MTVTLVKGWCPGALRPMVSGDGLIVRLKLTGGLVPLDRAAQIATWAGRWGNGQIDLTSRANLQIRGVTQSGIGPLQDAMASAGLLDASPEGEAVRNVIASPLAGIDPDALLDIRPVVAALEARLVAEEQFHGLPAKFCWLVDDAGSASLDDVRADVRFQAVLTDDGPAFAIRLDGSEEQVFGPCTAAEIGDIAARLAAVFIAREARRMRDLVIAVGGHTVAEAVSLKALARESGRGWREAPGEGAGDLDFEAISTLTLPACRLGPSLSRVAGEGLSVLGVGLPFGRIASRDLAFLAADALHHDASELRLTPWRTILIPLPTSENEQRLAESLPLDSFILDPADPRLRVAACVGAPACPRATTDVRTDAVQLARLVRSGDLLHVSGCAKGCAHPRAATVTLVGDGGTYDLVMGGAPWDAPVGTGLTIGAAIDEMRRIAAEGTAA